MWIKFHSIPSSLPRVPHWKAEVLLYFLLSMRSVYLTEVPEPFLASTSPNLIVCFASEVLCRFSSRMISHQKKQTDNRPTDFTEMRHSTVCVLYITNWLARNLCFNCRVSMLRRTLIVGFIVETSSRFTFTLSIRCVSARFPNFYRHYLNHWQHKCCILLNDSASTQLDHQTCDD